MESLKQILKDGSCKAFDCPRCALYKRGSGCELHNKLNHKIGTEEDFSLAELEYVRKKLENMEGK